MAYTTQQAVDTLNGYLGISEERKEYINDTKNRGFVLTLDSGEKIVIFIYPLVHKQDNTKNYFDTRDSGAYERGVAWKYALKNGLKYFCFGVNNQVDKFNDYVFSLECNETIIEKISGTKNGSRNGPGNQIIIPNDYVPSNMFERIKNRLGIYISAIRKDGIYDYLKLYDNRPYLSEDIDIDVESEDPEERNKRLFRYWMGLQVKPEGDSDAGNPYSNSSIDQYVSNVANTPLSTMPDRSVFYTTNIGDVETTIEVLDHSEKKNNTQRSALKKYLEYLKNLVSDDDCEEVFSHSLFGIHIKEKNNALSEDNPHGDLNTSMDGMISAEKDNIISKIFNKTDLASVNALLANTGSTWDDLQSSIENSGGAAQQMADTQLDNLQGQLTLLKSALEGLAISFGQLLMPALKSIVGVVQKVVDWLNSLDEGTKKVIVTVALVAGALGPVLIVVGKVISAVGTIMTIVPKLAGVINVVKGAFAALNTTMLVNAIKTVITTVWNGIKTAITTVMNTMLSTIMSSIPITPLKHGKVVSISSIFTIRYQSLMPTHITPLRCDCL